MNRKLAGLLLPVFLILNSCDGKRPDAEARKKAEHLVDSSSVSVRDIDGNSYLSIEIAGNRWMKENLRVKHFRNGDFIPDIKDPGAWGNINKKGIAEKGKCCSYDNDASLAQIFGLLYNWYAVSDSRLLCPTGWHMPADSDWSALSQLLGGPACAGAELREGTFTALPAGGREAEGSFTNRGSYAYFWNRNANDSSNNCAYEEGCAKECTLCFSASFLLQSATSKSRGMSVRCIKDREQSN
jgi:uncharacterized protein (TIGR02145 family)